MSKIIEKTKADKLLLELTCHIQQGYIPKLAKSSISDDSLLMRGNKIILPETLWDNAFSKAHHGGQQGINSLKRCIHSHFWFPQLNAFLENVIYAKCFLIKPQKSQYNQYILQITHGTMSVLFVWAYAWYKTYISGSRHVYTLSCS